MAYQVQNNPFGGQLLPLPDPLYQAIAPPPPPLPPPSLTNLEGMDGINSMITEIENQENGTAGGQNAFALPDIFSQLPQFPGYNNIMADLSGQIAPDVRRNIEQAAAERGVQLGVQGAPNTDAALLRALGLTTDIVKQRGQQNLLAALGQLTEQSKLQLQKYGIDTERDVAVMREQGLNARQLLDITAAMDRLKLSEDRQDQRQAAEIEAALERTRLGIAGARDLETLRQAGESERQEKDLALRRELGLGSLGLQGEELDLRRELGLGSLGLQERELDLRRELGLAGLAAGSSGGRTSGGIPTGRTGTGGTTGPNQATMDLLNRLLAGRGGTGDTAQDPYAGLQSLFNRLAPGRGPTGGTSGTSGLTRQEEADLYNWLTVGGELSWDEVARELGAPAPTTEDEDLYNWLTVGGELSLADVLGGGATTTDVFGDFDTGSAFYEPLSEFDMQDLEDFLGLGGFTTEEAGFYGGTGPLTAPELPGGGYGDVWDQLYSEVYGSDGGYLDPYLD